MATSRRLTFVAVLAIGFAGCGKSQSPVAPSAPILTGVWVGTGLFQSEATLTFTMVQSGSALSGTWAEGQGGPKGNLIGAASGSNVSITFSLLDSTSCPFPVEIIGLVNGSQMSGSYKTVAGYCVGSSFTSNGNGVWIRR